MPAPTASAKLRWEGEVPVSAEFNDPYYSRQDGLAETRHVFLAGNALEQRFAGAQGFAVAELGFGTGLNFLATLSLWRQVAAPGARLGYAAFELAPLPADGMRRALAPWPELAGLAEALLQEWPARRITLPDADLTLIIGDARKTVPNWGGQADAWYLDGFAPARNPQMWEPALLTAVHAHTAPGGTIATYSAAGNVRRALTAAGFQVARVPGHGRKREMLTGSRD